MTEPITPCIALLLDRSGSMAFHRTETIAAVNGYLNEATDDPALVIARFTLVTFDSASIDVVRDGEPLAQCRRLAENEFVPRGATPLLDAVAHAIALLERQGARTDPHILAIVTDGNENASVEHTRASIRALIEEKRKSGWLVLYLGANQDSWAEACSLGIKPGNVADYDVHAHDGVSVALKGLSSRYVASGTDGFLESELRQLKERRSRGG